MDKATCEYSNGCPEICPSYKKQCIRYCREYTKQVVTQFGLKTKLLKSEAKTCPKSGSIYLCKTKLTAIQLMLSSLQKNFSSVKVYTMSLALDALLGEELPNEHIILIDALSKYKEVENQYKALLSFVEKLADAGKVVIIVASELFPISNLIIKHD